MTDEGSSQINHPNEFPHTASGIIGWKAPRDDLELSNNRWCDLDNDRRLMYSSNMACRSLSGVPRLMLVGSISSVDAKFSMDVWIRKCKSTPKTLHPKRMYQHPRFAVQYPKALSNHLG